MLKTLIAVVGFALLLAGCSSNQSSRAPTAPVVPTPPPTPPAPPAPQVTDLHGTVASGTMQSFDVSLNDRQSSLTATLTWADNDVDLDLWLTDQGCQRVSLDCRLFGRATLPPGTGNKQTIQESPLGPSSTYRLWVQNFSGGKDEPFALEVQVR